MGKGTKRKGLLWCLSACVAVWVSVFPGLAADAYPRIDGPWSLEDYRAFGKALKVRIKAKDFALPGFKSADGRRLLRHAADPSNLPDGPNTKANPLEKLAFLKDWTKAIADIQNAYSQADLMADQPIPEELAALNGLELAFLPVVGRTIEEIRNDLGEKRSYEEIYKALYPNARSSQRKAFEALTKKGDSSFDKAAEHLKSGFEKDAKHPKSARDIKHLVIVDQLEKLEIKLSSNFTSRLFATTHKHTPLKVRRDITRGLKSEYLKLAPFYATWQKADLEGMIHTYIAADNAKRKPIVEDPEIRKGLTAFRAGMCTVGPDERGWCPRDKYR